MVALKAACTRGCASRVLGIAQAFFNVRAPIFHFSICSRLLLGLG